MTYLFKLSRRLSVVHRFTALALLAGGCRQAEERDFLSPTPGQPDLRVAAIAINPRVGTAKPGEQIQFTAKGTDGRGQAIPVDVSWFASGGTISASGVFTSDRIGQFSVIARSRQSPDVADSGFAAVFSSPRDILLLRVFPDSAVISTAEGIQLDAIARLADGSEVRSPVLGWTASGGTVDGSGWFTPGPAEGTYTVQASASTGVESSAKVVVQGNKRSIARLAIDPSNTTLAVGQSKKFTAMATYSDGSTSKVNAVWSATGGAINPDGTYSAGSTVGSYKVVARDKQGTLADSAVVTLVEPTVVALSISPASVTLAPTAVQQFTAAATMSDGSTRTVGVTWQATGGTVSGTGLYTAGASEGTFRVIGTVTGTVAADTSVVTIVKPAVMLTQILLNPSQANVPAGATQQFSVTGLYSDGSTGTPAVTWTARGGTITAGGLYTAGKTQGTYLVIATEQGGSRSDTSAVIVGPPALTQLVLNPSSVSLLSGQSTQFAVSGSWTDGSTAVPQVTWTADGGTITASGLFTAGNAGGTFRVIATQQGGSLADTSLVTVTIPPPTLQAVVLSPASVSLPPGGTYQFSVSGQWSNGSTAAPSVTWSATGGTVNSSGLYTAGTATGTYRVIATQSGGTLADTATVSITAAAPVLRSLTVSPTSTSLQVSTSRQFSVSGTWSDGSTGVPSVSWSATGGTITNGGLYVAGATAGSYQVIATQMGGGLADTAEVTVSAPVTLVGLVIQPDSQTVATGGTAQFTAAGLYSNGGTGSVSVTWSATGGTITAGGLYTAGSLGGTYAAIARVQDGTLADTSQVKVMAPTLTGVVVSPGTASLQTGAQKQFTVAGTWSDGSTTVPTVAWSATGGTITSGGLYTAGTVAGAYRVVALHQASGKADTAEVTLSAPVILTGIAVSPDGAALGPSQAQQFTATGLYSTGGTGSVAVTWSATGGAITSGGLYTAGTVAGTYRVVATQTGGSLADTVAVTVVVSSSPGGGFPAGYDPQRLGADLIVGESWQDLQFGADSGYASILTKAGWRQSDSPYPLPVPGQIALVPDAVFGRVIRINQPDYHTARWSATVEHIRSFPGVTRFWYRAVVRVDGQENKNGLLGAGFTSFGSGLVPGSTTYKLLFAWASDNQQRMEFELYNDGLFLLTGSTVPGNNVAGEQAVRLQQGGAPVSPVTRGQDTYVSGWLSTFDAGGEWRTNRDWYEFVMNYEVTGPNSILQRFFIRRLTVNGVWNPAPHPAWLGWATTNTVPKNYSRIHLGGNKSQTNDGPYDQFLFWGPWEVTTAQDPYGWDRYGR